MNTEKHPFLIIRPKKVNKNHNNKSLHKQRTRIPPESGKGQFKKIYSKLILNYENWMVSPQIKDKTRNSTITNCVARELSLQFSHSVVSDSLPPHESQHTRPPCPSPNPRVHSNSRPLSRWCHPAISTCRPLLLLPAIPPSIRVFSNESTLRMRWPKYWSFIFSISPSN